MADDLGKPLSKMRVDGGAAANDLLIQFQADVADTFIERPAELESTAQQSMSALANFMQQSGAVYSEKTSAEMASSMAM